MVAKWGYCHFTIEIQDGIGIFSRPILSARSKVQIGIVASNQVYKIYYQKKCMIKSDKIEKKVTSSLQ